MRLKDVADIRPGYPFREAVEEVPGGNAAVVQIKNADIDHGVDWPNLVHTKLEGRRNPDWLRDGDILFTARGNRNFAVCVGDVPFQAVCSPQFFLVRLKDHAPARPSFVSWLMNQAEAQRYLAQEATGSFIKNIRRKVLEDMPLTLPSLEKQEIVIKLNSAAQREKVLLQKLIYNRDQQMNAISENLIG